MGNFSKSKWSKNWITWAREKRVVPLLPRPLFPRNRPFLPPAAISHWGSQPKTPREGETPSLPPFFLSFQLLLCARADPGVGVGYGGGSFVRRAPGRRRRELLAGIAAAKDGLGLGGGSRKRGEGDHWHRLRRRRYRWRRRRRRRKERSQGVRGRRVGRLPFSEENGEGTHTPVVNVEFRNCS